jgi:hypothetical protein
MQNTKTNSANSASQPTDTASNGNDPTRTRANRRIDTATISEIARLCARQLSESEACRKIGVRPQAWFSWKSRHNRSEKFSALLEEFRANRIDDLITRVENSAAGIGVKFPDFRAALALLKITDHKRFGDSPAVEINNTFAPMLTPAQMDRIQREFLKSKAAVKIAPPPKQISNAEIMPERVAKNE